MKFDINKAPDWATEAFGNMYSGPDEYYFGNDKQYRYCSGDVIHEMNKLTLDIISSSNWWREPISIDLENE